MTEIQNSLKFGFWCLEFISDRYYFNLVIEDFDVKVAVGHKIDHFGENLVGETGIVADKTNPNGGELP